MRNPRTLPAILSLVVVQSTWAWAQERAETVTAVGAEVQQLRDRVAALERQLAALAGADRRPTALPGIAVVGGGPTGAMPLTIASGGLVIHSQQTTGNPLSSVFGVAQHRGIANGGPQALEGYVFMDPPAGETVRLALSVIGNAEHAGAGETIEVRSPGGVVSGPGRVREWWMSRPVIDILHAQGSIDTVYAYGAVFPRTYPANVRQRWGLYFDDATVPHRLDGVVHLGALRFSNGWMLRPEGDTLTLVRPDGSVSQVFR
jgi:hypothetical protein